LAKNKKDADLSAHRIPPQNLEAERSVLGGMLLDNQAIHQVLEILDGDDFYSSGHKKIFQSIIDLTERNEPADLITLSNLLKDRSQLDPVGGAAYLGSLVDAVPSAANIGYYSKIVKEKSVLRKLISATTGILSKTYENATDIDGIIDEAEYAIFQISENKVRQSFFPIREIIKDSFRTIERLFEKKSLITGVPTGFEELDRMTSGFQRSDLIIIAGRPSMGKTAFALNVAQHAAIEMDVPVAVFSLEMSKEQLAMRMLSSEARVDA
jgi:replicative DNA helicase